MPNRNGTANGSPIAAVGSLANIATLVVIITAAIGLSHKLDSLAADADRNCRNTNAAIILTLEGTRQRARERGTEGDLNRIIARFERITESCGE